MGDGKNVSWDAQIAHENSQGATFPYDKLTRSWLGAAGIGVATGVLCFLAVRFGLALKYHVGMAVFWPSAGIAAGALIVLGPAARVPVTVGAALASIVAHLLIGRHLGLTMTFAALDAAKILLIAWLVERWFGRVFKLENVLYVLGLLVASTIATALCAAGATTAISVVDPTTIPLRLFRVWFAATLLGIITVAPLVIGLGEAVHDPPPRREQMEGATALLILAALSAFLISLPDGPWATALPVILVLPVILYVAARCRPLFAAAAVFLTATTVIWSMTSNMRQPGETIAPVEDRVLAAQTLLLAGGLLILVLAALFSDRRRSEATLKESKERLQLAIDGAALGAFSADLATGRLECDARAAWIHGHSPPLTSIKESRRFIHPDDRVRIDAAVTEAKRSGGKWNAEYRVLPPPGHPDAGETRWIAVDGSLVRDRQGVPVRLFGVTRDITERKRVLADVDVQRSLAGRAGLVGTYAYEVAYDAGAETAQISAGYAAILGLPEGTTEITRSQWLAAVHPEDVERLQALRDRAFHGRQREYKFDYRLIRLGEVRWSESRTFISYDSDGRPQRVIGVNIDITDRKRAEERQHALVAELDHRVKNVLATVSAIVSQSRQGSTSIDNFVMALEGRVRSMATTHELLSSDRWQGISLTKLVHSELAAYARSNNVKLKGPEVILRPEAGQVMAIVLHELATNAAKYGALSTQNGRVSICWMRRLNGQPQLLLEWQEIGGPPVIVSGSSYGTSTIRDLIPYELGGTVDLVLAPGGVRCRLQIPGDWWTHGTARFSEAQSMRTS